VDGDAGVPPRGPPAEAPLVAASCTGPLAQALSSSAAPIPVTTSRSSTPRKFALGQANTIITIPFWVLASTFAAGRVDLPRRQADP